MVVGKPAATVMTSSPGFSRRSPSLGEVRAVSASRFADDPELTSEAQRTPTKRASLRSKSSAKRPVVNQASRADSTTALTSAASITLPETGMGVTPGLNSEAGKASSKYWAVSSRICCRSRPLTLVIGVHSPSIPNRIIAVYCISQGKPPTYLVVFWLPCGRPLIGSKGMK